MPSTTPFSVESLREITDAAVRRASLREIAHPAVRRASRRRGRLPRAVRLELKERLKELNDLSVFSPGEFTPELEREANVTAARLDEDEAAWAAEFAKTRPSPQVQAYATVAHDRVERTWRDTWRGVSTRRSEHRGRRIVTCRHDGRHRRASAARPVRLGGSRRVTGTSSSSGDPPGLADEPPLHSSLLLGGGR